MNREPAIAEAIARTVAAYRLRRVPLRELLVAAASIDRTAAATVGWRARVLAAITDLAGNGTVQLPRTRMDRSADPPLPAYVVRPAEPRPEGDPRARVVWHAELEWVAELDDAGRLGPAERRFLMAVNAWLPHRRGVQVPMRERSLEILGDEKELERWVLGALFGADRLSVRQLDCYPCWPPVEHTRLGQGDWLVIENYTTYVSVSRRARALGFNGLLVWGSGNQVGTRLAALVATGAARPDRCWYFGDIDAGGFRVARSAVARAGELGLGPVVPAGGLYALALHGGLTRRARGGRSSAEIARWARAWLGGDLGDRAADIVSNGERVVQEHVGVEVLADTELSEWFTSDVEQPG